MSPSEDLSPSAYRDKHIVYNFVVNLLDGGFFGMALGFASFVTVIPLFVSTLTDSAILIGLIPAIHTVGWQLPQLFTANHVSRQRRYRPMVLWITVHERLPFLGLAAVAWFIPAINADIALLLIFALLVWQGLGGGFAATAWQSMIGKIIPGGRHGVFFGMQAATANLFLSVSAVLAGVILERVAAPLDFTLCFLLASFAMMVSWGLLALTREFDSPPKEHTVKRGIFGDGLISILRSDVNFRWFLVARMLSQVAAMAFSFYTVYAVRDYGMGEGTAGVMTGVLAAVQIIANPVMGWFGDRWSRRGVMGIGGLAASLSALIAWKASGVVWFFPVFILMGIANVALWTISLAMTLEFGDETARPVYIGLANTLVAPSAILAPLIGGWLADNVGYQATFLVSALGGLATAALVFFVLGDTQREGESV